MSVLPKSLFVLGATLKTARTARRLKHSNTAVPAQHRAFAKLRDAFAVTEVGRASGIERGMSYEAFRTRAPLRQYEQFAPYIERMKSGEANVLWPGQCSLYAVTSGTATGHPKWLPITEEMLIHFRHAGVSSLLFYTARTGHCGIFRGRHLLLGGLTAVTSIAQSTPFPAFAGDLSAIAALNLPPGVEQHFYEPGGEIAQLTDWSKKINAIIARTRSVDITLVAGFPSWLIVFLEALLKSHTGKTAANALHEIWPNLECVLHGGVPITTFQDDLRRLVGPDVNFHEVYAASEGLIAAQDADALAGLRLLADAGIFYEFLPLDDYDEALPSSLGARAVPLEGVTSGVDYVLLLSSPAGLCRYVIGDVVRFTSVKPPRLIYVGRTKDQLSVLGERVNEKELTESLVAVCQRHNWAITNFHVAPLSIKSLTGQNRGRHEWWVELRAGTIETPRGPFLAEMLDAELMIRSQRYAGKRKTGMIEAPIVRLVMPGFFEHWMRHKDRWGGQNKLPRCRSDRRIADALSSIACFTED
jgi:hypothetical protein